MKWILRIFVGIVLLPSFTFAAIAFDAASSGLLWSTTNTTFTGSMTIVSAANTIVIVQIETDSGSELISSVSGNGVAMTQINKVIHPASNAWFYQYWGAATTTGTYAVTLTTSGSVSSRASSVSYSGVSTVTPINTSGSNSNSSGNATVTVQPSIANCWAEGWVFNTDAVVIASTNVNATRQSIFTGQWQVGDSNGTITSGVDYTMTWTSAAGFWISLGAAFCPPSAATPAAPFTYAFWW